MTEVKEGLGLASADLMTSGNEGSRVGGVGGGAACSRVGTCSITRAGVRGGQDRWGMKVIS